MSCCCRLSITDAFLKRVCHALGFRDVEAVSCALSGDMEALGCLSPEQRQHFSFSLELHWTGGDAATTRLEYEAELRRRPDEPWLSLESEEFHCDPMPQQQLLLTLVRLCLAESQPTACEALEELLLANYS